MCILVCETVNVVVSIKKSCTSKVDAEKHQSPRNVFFCCDVAASGGEELMHWGSSQITPLLILSYSSRPSFLASNVMADLKECSYRPPAH